MLKNLKIKNIIELNSKFNLSLENKICENNKEFVLPILFNNYYIEKIFILNENCNLETIYSITYDEVIYNENN